LAMRLLTVTMLHPTLETLLKTKLCHVQWAIGRQLFECDKQHSLCGPKGQGQVVCDLPLMMITCAKHQCLRIVEQTILSSQISTLVLDNTAKHDALQASNANALATQDQLTAASARSSLGCPA